MAPGPSHNKSVLRNKQHAQQTPSYLPPSPFLPSVPLHPTFHDLRQAKLRAAPPIQLNPPPPLSPRPASCIIHIPATTGRQGR